MAQIDANIHHIRRKTLLTYAVSLAILLAVSFFLAYFRYNRNVYHIQFFRSYLHNMMGKTFFENMFFVTMTATVFCYTLIVGRGDVISKSGQRLLFHQLVASGIIILGILTFVNILSSEIFIPKFNAKLDLLSNSTLRANTALRTANALYEKADYERSIKYYQEYLSIIDDTDIDARLLEVKNKINIPKQLDVSHYNRIISRLSGRSDAEFIETMYQRKVNNMRYINANVSDDERRRVWTILNDIDFFGGDYTVEGQLKYAVSDSSVSDKITNYSELADIYFDRHDYLTAWYYYQYTVEKHTAESRKAQDRINKIKVFLREEYADMDDAQFESFIRETQTKINGMYNLKNRGAKYLADNQYQKAFFTFSDILSINSNLRDASIGQSKSLALLRSIGVDYNEINQVRNYSGKSNFVFMLNDNRLITAKTIIKVYDMNTLHNNYYMYDVSIWEYDDYHNVKSVIHSEYGQIKDDIRCTLYCFSTADRSLEFFPTKTTYDINGKALSDNVIKDNFIINIPVGINTLYNFSNSYDKALECSLIQLIRLSRMDKIVITPASLTKYEVEVIAKNTLSPEARKALEAVYYYHEADMCYHLRSNAKKSEIDLMMTHLTKENFINHTKALGFEKKFIKAAILDQISRMFLFIVLGLFLITLSWRTKADYIGMIPAAQMPLLVLIPVFVFLMIKILQTLITIGMSTISNLITTTNNPDVAFGAALACVIAFWTVMAVTAMIVLAYNRAE